MFNLGYIHSSFLKDEYRGIPYFAELAEKYPDDILTDLAKQFTRMDGFSDEVNTDKNESVELSTSYPNPFNPTAQIGYQIPKDGFVSLIVYNALGQVVAELVNKHQTSGKYSVQFNGSGLSSGVYFYRLESGNFTQTNKMILLK